MTNLALQNSSALTPLPAPPPLNIGHRPIGPGAHRLVFCQANNPIGEIEIFAIAPEAAQMILNALAQILPRLYPSQLIRAPGAALDRLPPIENGKMG